MSTAGAGFAAVAVTGLYSFPVRYCVSPLLSVNAYLTASTLTSPHEVWIPFAMNIQAKIVTVRQIKTINELLVFMVTPFCCFDDSCCD